MGGYCEEARQTRKPLAGSPGTRVPPVSHSLDAKRARHLAALIDKNEQMRHIRQRADKVRGAAAFFIVGDPGEWPEAVVDHWRLKLNPDNPQEPKKLSLENLEDLADLGAEKILYQKLLGKTGKLDAESVAEWLLSHPKSLVFHFVLSPRLSELKQLQKLIVAWEGLALDAASPTHYLFLIIHTHKPAERAKLFPELKKILTATGHEDRLLPKLKSPDLIDFHNWLDNRLPADYQEHQEYFSEQLRPLFATEKTRIPHHALCKAILQKLGLAD